MVRVRNVLSLAMAATVFAVGVSVVATVAVLLASVTGWLLSRYLPFTPFEATGLWLAAGSVVTLVAGGVFVSGMVSATQQAQTDLLERVARNTDDWDGDDGDDDEEDDDEEDEDDEASAPIFVTPLPREVAARRVLSRARRSR